LGSALTGSRNNVEIPHPVEEKHLSRVLSFHWVQMFRVIPVGLARQAAVFLT
jgi:hypothetical protein